MKSPPQPKRKRSKSAPRKFYAGSAAPGSLTAATSATRKGKGKKTRTQRALKPDASQGKSPAQASVTVCAAPQKPTDPILKILNEVQEGLTNIGKDANLQAEKLRIVEGFLRNPILETNSPGQEPLRYLA